MGRTVVVYGGEIYHYGVLGMKWGKRKNTSSAKSSISNAVKKTKDNRNKKEKDLQDKMEKTLKNKSSTVREDDRRLFEHRSQSYGKRVSTSFAGAVTASMLKDLMNGDKAKYATMSKEQIALTVGLKLAKSAGVAVANVAIKDAQAKQAAKRYDSDGKRIGDTKQIKKQDRNDAIAKIAVSTLPTVIMATKLGVDYANHNRARNQNTFEKWGSNILSEKVDNVVWQSDDLSSAVIDNRKR